MNVKFQVFTLALSVFSLGAVACANAQVPWPGPVTVTLTGPTGGLQPPGVTFGLLSVVTCTAIFVPGFNAWTTDLYTTGSYTRKGHFQFTGLIPVGAHTFNATYYLPVNWSWASTGDDTATPSNGAWSGWIGPI